MITKKNTELEDAEKFPAYVRESAAHSRSYCHHLLKREELLGYQLLTVLNLAVYDQFFREIRAALAAGNLQEWAAEFLKMNFSEEPEAKRVRRD